LNSDVIFGQHSAAATAEAAVVPVFQQSDTSEEYKDFQLPAGTFSEMIPKKRNRTEKSTGATKSNSSVGFVEKDSSIAGLRAPSALSGLRVSPRQRCECNLVNAAIRGSKKGLIAALQDGEDANDCDNFGMTALYHAATRNFTDLCRILIENGALINAHECMLAGSSRGSTCQLQAADIKAFNNILF
uniref:ANK_REP_REGION domain-containing protein n=1 Tax=Gongylonema pulchrum TaxID=637853 RepID=A0A183D0K2_9BILA